MLNDTIFLSYNGENRKINSPNNYTELKNIFLNEYNEDKNKIFSFGYLSNIDKFSKFQNIINKVIRKQKPIIYVNLVEKNQNNNMNVLGTNLDKCYKLIKTIKIQFQKLKTILELIEINLNTFESSNLKIKFKDIKKLENKIKIKEEIININKDLEKSTSINHINNLFYSNPKDISLVKDITNKSFCKYTQFAESFIIFNSINNIYYLVYTNICFSIIFHNLIDNKMVNEIKKAHDLDITSFRHYLDKINKRDLILSTSFKDNNIKVWNVNNLECLINIEKVNEFGCLLSACFLNDNNQIYIVTSNYRLINLSRAEFIKVFDLNGKKIKDINNKKKSIIFIDSFYDNKLSKNIIITSQIDSIVAFDYNSNQIYKIYSDIYDINYRNNIIVVNFQEEKLFIESSKDGIIRIWSFYSGILLNKIKVVEKYNLSYICLWNNNYLFTGCSNNLIKLIDLNKGKVVNELKGHNNEVKVIKKFIHPQLGECLISQGLEDGCIKLWINKNNNN